MDRDMQRSFKRNLETIANALIESDTLSDDTTSETVRNYLDVYYHNPDKINVEELRDVLAKLLEERYGKRGD